jgi:hypothetical protein
MIQKNKHHKCFDNKWIKIYENFYILMKENKKSENLTKVYSSKLDECNWTNYKSRFK